MSQTQPLQRFCGVVADSQKYQILIIGDGYVIAANIDLLLIHMGM